MEKDFRLDREKQWRLLVTPMVCTLQEHSVKWDYGHAFCGRSNGQPSGIIKMPYCTYSNQQTVYRRNTTEKMTAPMLPASKGGKKMPLLKKMHQMRCPAVVTQTYINITVAMCIENFKCFFSDKTKVVCDMKPENSTLDGSDIQTTKIRVYMNWNYTLPTENVQEMFQRVQLILKKFPNALLMKKEIVCEALIPRLPKARFSKMFPQNLSSSVVRIMPFKKEIASTKMEYVVENSKNKIEECLEKWKSPPWHLAHTQTAISVYCGIMHRNTEQSPQLKIVKLLLSREKKKLEGFYKSMRYQGFVPEIPVVNEKVLFHIIFVMYYFFKLSTPLEWRPSHTHLSVIGMQRLVEAIHEKYFIVNRIMIPLESDVFKRDFQMFISKLREGLTQCYFNEYTRYIKNSLLKYM
jgi:hypothetical protein